MKSANESIEANLWSGTNVSTFALSEDSATALPLLPHAMQLTVTNSTDTSIENVEKTLLFISSTAFSSPQNYKKQYNAQQLIHLFEVKFFFSIIAALRRRVL
jgi:hypothetical protein